VKPSKPLVVGTVAGLGLALIFAGGLRTQRRIVDKTASDGSTQLPNGWRVRPAGESIALAGDMPIKMAFLPGSSKLLVVTGGYHNQGLSVIDVASNKVDQTVELGSAWAGLALSDDTAYVSGGGSAIRTVSLASPLVRGKELRPYGGESTKGKKKRKAAADQFVAGMLWLGNSLFVVDLSGDSLIQMQGEPLSPVHEVKVGYHPYAVVPSPDQKQLAVSNWGDSSVSLINVGDFKESSRIKVGSHPNEMVWGSDGRLFVANAGSNDVSVISDGKVTETIKTSISPRDLVGSTPDALALSPDSKTLYVANADNNDVAVIDVSGKSSFVKGFIPTGWYPSAIALSPDGKKLYVGTGKGLKFDPNAPAKTKFTRTEYNGTTKYDYIGGVLSGHVNVLDVPDSPKLKEYTKIVAECLPQPTDGSIPLKQQKVTVESVLKKIKHVVYVIRENRTYDQVFGDLPKGNNDPGLVLFGKDVTPNAHALTQRFVQFDNLYCNGEVSEDGHQWCDAAYCTDFTEKAWVNSYAGKGEPDADDRLTASPAGYLWDNCRAHGVSYYSYGEQSSFHSDPDTPPVFTGQSGLNGHGSLEWAKYTGDGGFGRDYEKVQVFIDDLKKGEQSGNWPAFMVMSLGEDHTKGLKAGALTPQASVASNDLGLAKMIEAVSHSKYWKDTAFFIIEDDAQNGPDHVDSHRTVGLIVSPYIRPHTLDSTLYTTASFVRTMELILGLPPMSQFDERATPVLQPFTSKPDLTPYTVVPETVDLNATNPEKGLLVEASNRLDFSDYDRADPDLLNSILWRAIKKDRPMPAPTRSAHVIR